jgi:tripartite-type tricarboxylate transporter receptor subunit TctC
MNQDKRKFNELIILASAYGFAPELFAQPSLVDTYPKKSIRILCPFAPSGGVDITARAIAQQLTQSWGQSVIVDNKPGANGTIAVETAIQAPPDGYTLTMISSSHSVNSTLLKNQSYDLIKDLAPITQITRQPYVLVINPNLPVTSVAELLAYAKKKAKSLTYGSSGIGGFSHLAGGLFSLSTKTEMLHIPYKGGSLAMNDVISGQIDMLFSTILQSHGHINTGRLRPLAVTTTQRSSSLPDIPTMQEAGIKDYEVLGWYGIVASTKVPKPILNKLNREIVQILKLPEISQRLQTDGSEAVGSSQEEFGEFIKAQVAKWRTVINALKIQI